MKNGLIEFIIVVLLFFAGTGSLLFIDGICFETTGEGGAGRLYALCGLRNRQYGNPILHDTA